METNSRQNGKEKRSRGKSVVPEIQINPEA